VFEETIWVERHCEEPTRPPDNNNRLRRSNLQRGNVIAIPAINSLTALACPALDSQCFASLLTNTITNLKEHGVEVEEVYADAGYSSGEALKALEENNITGYIPNFGQYKPLREGFIYDEVNDRYTCQRGVHLCFKKLTTTSLGYKMKVYRSSAKDCGPCPLRSVCIGKSDFKKIDDSIDKPYYDRMQARLESVNRHKIKRIRSSTVEPVLGR